uniref:Uncharacterized protein n=1 Tax=Arundo donax TaxID=35708 RepID=A0A0A9FKH4_ARUDO
MGMCVGMCARCACVSRCELRVRTDTTVVLSSRDFKKNPTSRDVAVMDL